jgi:phage-related protein
VVEIVRACEKELKAFSDEVRGDLADALARLEAGLNLSLPLSRPMPSIAPGAHELRFRDRAGIYRVIYWIRRQNEIWLIHAFAKKTQQTPTLNIEVAKQRIKRIG